MFEKKLIALAEQKARVLGLKYAGINVVPYDSVLDDYVKIGTELNMDVIDGRLVLKPSDGLEDVPDEELELIVEHIVSGFAHYLEGICGREVAIANGESPKMVGLEMDEAYRSYLASKRQIDAFGMERFEMYQRRGLEEFVSRTKRLASIVPNFVGKTILVSSFYKEKIKCDLMENSTSSIPAVIGELVAPFRGCFEKINGTGFEWVDKARLLYVMTTSHLLNVSVAESYLEGELRMLGSWTDVSPSLHRNGDISDSSLEIATELERMMKEGYVGVPQTPPQRQDYGSN